MYVLKEDGPTVFGPKCDIAPPSFSVKKNHCTVQPDGDGFCIIGGKGETAVKSKAITEGDKVALAQYDWISMVSHDLSNARMDSNRNARVRRDVRPGAGMHS